MELDVRLELTERFAAHVSYSRTHATFEIDGTELFSIREEHGGENEVEKGDRLPLVPAQVIQTGADLSTGAGLDATLLLRHTGRRWLRGDEASEEDPLPAHTVLDGSAGWSWRGWSVRARADNLLNARYPAFGTFNLNQSAGGVLERFLTPGAPRSFTVTVSRALGSS